jgi:hypothetical protein
VFVTVSLGDIAACRNGFHEGGAFKVSARLYFGERQGFFAEGRCAVSVRHSARFFAGAQQ